MERIKIGNTDIFLEDYGENRGKIIISDTYGYNFSYYWGSMGSDLREFLLRINEGYFVDKLCTDRKGDFSGERTVKEIRKTMRDSSSVWEINWYEHMEAQKELRQLLKNLEGCDCMHSFYYECGHIVDHYWGAFYSWDERAEQKEFEENVKYLLEDPHHYFMYVDSNEHIFLKKLFKDLQKELKKDLIPV